jgi:hypothetical protein
MEVHVTNNGDTESYIYARADTLYYTIMEQT